MDTEKGGAGDERGYVRVERKPDRVRWIIRMGKGYMARDRTWVCSAEKRGGSMEGKELERRFFGGGDGVGEDKVTERER